MKDTPRRCRERLGFATCGFIGVALLSGVITVHAADFNAGVKAYEGADYATALRIFRQLADQGDGDAQYSLGVMHYTGQGVPHDHGEAMKWFRKAADQGIASAQHNLGFMYYNGQVVPEDYKEAVRWYRKSADQGNASAQSNLGVMYATGYGVPEDYVQAHMWFNLAAAQGYDKAKKNRDVFAKKMSVEQIAQAQKLARDWKPTKISK